MVVLLGHIIGVLLILMFTVPFYNELVLARKYIERLKDENGKLRSKK